MKVALACGGTGGHIFPGLATADVLRQRGHEVILWMAGKDVESTAVQGWSGPVLTVKAEGLPTSLSFQSFTSALRLLRVANQCRSLMREQSPDVLLAMGSYASFGPVVAALRAGIPCVLHESNAVPGRAISLLARWADAVGISFEETHASLRRGTLVFTGMPLRAELTRAAEQPRTSRGGLFHLLVMGGSRGAHALNEIVGRAVCGAHARGVAFRVTHLAGVADAEAVRARYKAANVPSRVEPFSHDMAAIYSDADFAICRSGAASCAELLAFALPSLLIPYPSAVRDHQTANAAAMERVGASQRISETDLTEAWMADYIADVALHTERLARMRESARHHAQLHAADALADLVLKIAEGRRVVRR